MGEPDVGVDGALIYTCPMHPEVVNDEAGRCPQCGMKLSPKPRRRATPARCTRSRERDGRPLPEVRDEAHAGRRLR